MEPATLRSGARVRINDLVTRADLNGTLADVIEWVPGGRWAVRCSNGEHVKIRTRNLTVVALPRGESDDAAYKAAGGDARALEILNGLIGNDSSQQAVDVSTPEKPKSVQCGPSSDVHELLGQKVVLPRHVMCND